MRKCQLKIFFSQEALAIAFETEETRIGNPDCYFSLLSKQMEQKRNELSTYLNDAGLVPITPGGGYFIVADISSIGMHIWHRQWFWRQMKFWSFQEIQRVLINMTLFLKKCSDHFLIGGYKVVEIYFICPPPLQIKDKIQKWTEVHIVHVLQETIYLHGIVM